jgi:hypothetical protein
VTMPTSSADPTARLGSAVEDHLASLSADEFSALVGRTRPPEEQATPPAPAAPPARTPRPPGTVAGGQAMYQSRRGAR